MTAFVVDASVAVKWLIEEEDSDAAAVVLAKVASAEIVLHVPDLIYSEIASVLCKKFRVADLKTADVRDAVADFLQIPLTVHPAKDLFARALEIAIQSGRSAYDSQYLALAENLDLELITADRRFYRGLAGTKWKRYPLWVGHFS